MKTNQLINSNDLEAVELYLAPNIKVYEAAEKVAKNFTDFRKYNFIITFNPYKKDYLCSVIAAAGGIINEEKSYDNTITVLLNKEQLKLVKSLDIVERVEVDRQDSIETERTEINQATTTNFTLTNSAENGTMKIAEQTSNSKTEIATLSLVSNTASNEGIAMICVEDNCTDSNCSDDNCSDDNSQNCDSLIEDAITEEIAMSATPLNYSTSQNGCICCYGSAIWYKFVARNTDCTVYTEGSLDTVGYLYDSDGKKIDDDDDSNVDLNFQLYATTLTIGETYYVKVKGFGGGTGCFTIHLRDSVYVSDVVVSPKMITLISGQQAQIYTNVYPSEATNQTLSLFSDDDEIATVDSTGKITARKAGITKINAYATDGSGQNDYCTVTVRYCGGNNYKDITQHTLKLQKDGYYECTKCGYRLKSPALQDREVLNMSDYLSIVSLYHECAVVIEQYPSYLSPLLAMIDGIRSLPENVHRYDYCDSTGKYVPEYNTDFYPFRMYINVNQGSCKNEWVLLNSMFFIVGATIPFPYSFMFDAISDKLLQEHPSAQGFTGGEIVEAYLSSVIEKKYPKLMPVLLALSLCKTANDIVNTPCTNECYNVSITMLSKSAPFDCYQIEYHFSNDVNTIGRCSEHKVNGYPGNIECNVDYLDHVNAREYRLYE